MKKLIVAPLFLLLSSLPLVAVAGSESGLYIGGSVGQTSVESDFGDDTSFKLDDDDNGYKVFFGYNFGLVPFLDLAIEADYREYGKFVLMLARLDSSVSWVTPTRIWIQLSMIYILMIRNRQLPMVRAQN
jgi:hypothetical protein